jgi:4-hydroxybenzoate polyprenyltransferase/phosphoserine phosphatase
MGNDTLLSNEDLPPLVVDLDGTLTPTDTLIESIVRVVKRNPLDVLKFPSWLMNGRATFKGCIASRSGFSAKDLPYRELLVDYIRDEKKRGRQTVLATAANWRIAESVAKHLGLFDHVLASDETVNLKGLRKLAAIQEKVGQRFVYAGDSADDLPIWTAAEASVLVGTSTRVARAVRSQSPIEREFPNENGRARVWLKALRIHQWVKNLLLLVPLLTAFAFSDTDKLLAAGLAFLAFSFAASASYLLNDVWDLESDRAHPRKRHRPIASAQIPISIAVTAAASLLVLALVLAATLTRGFLLSLLLYLVVTSAYSWVLKQYVLIDVLTLSVLYTLRILAGSMAIGVETSSWLLAFSVFMFFSLALVKRCSELVFLAQTGQDATRGRDYRAGDLVVLWPLGVGAGLCAVVVFGQFISTPETQARYASPQLLWLVGIGLTYWLARLWVKTARGEMHDDPLVFALRDRGGRLTVLAMITATLIAHFVHLGS